MKQIIKDSAGLLSANVAAQALGLLVYPLLTRLYSPEDFGLLYIFTSVSSVLVLLGTAGYQFAIPLPKRETDGVACFYAGIIVLLPVLLLLLLLLPLRHYVAGWLGSEQLGSWLFWMPLYVCLLCLWNLLNGWWTRQRQFRYIGAYQLSSSVLSAGVKLLLGWLGVSGGLMWGTVSTPIAAVGGNAGMSAGGLRPLKMMDWESTKQALKRYRNFPFYTLPLSLINQFFGQLPAYLLAPMFGEAALGRWSMALLLSFAPINMVCNSIYQVLFAHVSERVRLGEGIREWFMRLERWTLLAVVPVFAALYFVLPWLTGVLLGEEWTETGHYIRWFLPWLSVTVLTSSTAFLPDIFSRQRVALLFEVLLALLRTFGIVAGMLTSSFEVAVAGYGIGSAVSKGAQYIWMRGLVGEYERGRSNAGRNV